MFHSISVSPIVFEQLRSASSPIISSQTHDEDVHSDSTILTWLINAHLPCPSQRRPRNLDESEPQQSASEIMVLRRCRSFQSRVTVSTNVKPVVESNCKHQKSGNKIRPGSKQWKLTERSSCSV